MSDKWIVEWTAGGRYENEGWTMEYEEGVMEVNSLCHPGPIYDI